MPFKPTKKKSKKEKFRNGDHTSPENMYASERQKNAVANAKKRKAELEAETGESADMVKARDKLRKKLKKDPKTGQLKTQSLAYGYYTFEPTRIKEYPHLKPLVGAADKICVVLKDKTILTLEVTDDGLSIRKTAKDGSAAKGTIFMSPVLSNVITVL